MGNQVYSLADAFANGLYEAEKLEEIRLGAIAEEAIEIVDKLADDVEFGKFCNWMYEYAHMRLMPQ